MELHIDAVQEGFDDVSLVYFGEVLGFWCFVG